MKKKTGKDGVKIVPHAQALVVVAVRDLISEAFMTPNYFHNAGSAVRAFMDSVNDPQTALNKHPEHYILYQVATWNPGSGEYENELAPRQLALGSESIQPKQ